MDDAERLPIDIGYDFASPALPSDPRATVRDDGTPVIDVLAPPPCQPSSVGEIVVCARVHGEDGAPDPPPPSPTAADKLAEALHTKIGPVEIGSIAKGDGTRAFGVRVRF